MTGGDRNQVVPWGRSLEEYRQMFMLSDEELKLRVLGVGDGPASFNSEMKALNHTVVSIDPIYAFSKEQIEERIEKTFATVISQVKQKPDDFVWDFFASPEHLGCYRLETMQKFLQDFDMGKVQGRYLPQSLPKLCFGDGQFDLAICSHLLFLYSDQLSLAFHRESIQELCRVSREVRIFPLLALDCRKSPHISPIQSSCRDMGFTEGIYPVAYEFQKGGNAMMRIRRATKE
ncbi:MAG: SAM-dependent methyltransferase [Candidatus Poribacteria bacterium]|nr:SAM-dependent methyltransferase [Candidatus Poribacteria bacterium]